MGQQIFRRIHAACAYCDRRHSTVTSTKDVVGRVAYDYELLRKKVKAEVTIDALNGECGQVSAVVRVIAERARQLEELRKPYEPHLQMRCGLYVACEK